MACSQIIQTVETKGGTSNLEEATYSSSTNNGQPQVHMWLFLMRLNVDLSEVNGRCRYHACDIGARVPDVTNFMGNFRASFILL